MLLYTAHASFIIEGETKTLHDKEKLDKFMATKPSLQNTHKGILYTEEEEKHNPENTGNRKSHQLSRLTNED
jgi:hypothetical protein